MTVGDTLADVLAHPWRRLVLCWNWKAATLSALIRGGIFFAASLTSGVAAAGWALLVDATFRIPMVGLGAAFVQAFVGTRPPWAATVVVALVVPAVAHVVEFTAHHAARTPGIRAGVVVSVALSVVSSAFQLFAMRRGMFLTGEGAPGLIDDLGRLPRVVAAFVTAVRWTRWRRTAGQ